MKSIKLLFFAIICFICHSSYSLSPALAEDTTFVPLKEWKDYTAEEKTILRERWTDEKVNAVVKAIKGEGRMPGFVGKLPPYTHDLRGIPLAKRALRNAMLTNTNLQGADLLGAYLQGATLRDANLQGAFFAYASLQRANLWFAKLQGAGLFAANLQGADLSKAGLDSAYLWSADLRGANLSNAGLDSADLLDANLQGAILWGANLQRARLSRANLRGTVLESAKLQDADLFRATFDYTFLWLVNLGEAKNIRYIQWGDSINNRYVIGEEKQADSTKSDEAFRRAEITYRDLKTLYKKELMDDVAGEFHFRENHVITKRYLRTKSEPFKYLWGLFRRFFLEQTYGYGSRPIWLLRSSLFVITLFFLIFAFVTIRPRTKSGIYLVQPGRRGEKVKPLTFRKGRLFLDCFYFSLLSFVTFGYGALQPRLWLQFFRLQPVEFKPVRWARIFVGIEATLGIWIFALLVTVLFGRG